MSVKASTGPTPGIEVSSALFVDFPGSIASSSVTVNSGATLGGTGTVGC
jgi:hypothetical protein